MLLKILMRLKWINEKLETKKCFFILVELFKSTVTLNYIYFINSMEVLDIKEKRHNV